MSATVLHNRHHPQNGAWRKSSTRARARTNEQALKTDDLRTGNAVKASGNVEKSSRRSLQFGFTGRYLDAETGLYYFRSRYYSGSLGRFIARDPLRYVDGMSLYAGYYAPNHLDRYGLSIEDGYNPESAQNMPWKYKKFAGNNDLIQYGITIASFNVVCNCIDCAESNKDKEKCKKIKCVTDLSSHIYLNDNFRNGDMAGFDGRVHTERGTYGHEQKHVQSLIDSVKAMLAEFEPKTEVCNTPSKCELLSKEIEKDIRDKYDIIYGNEADHEQGEGGNTTGTPKPSEDYPPINDDGKGGFPDAENK